MNLIKIESYRIMDKNIELNFDREFKHIKYIKLVGESLCISGELDCDEAEIKFIKNKRSLNIYNEATAQQGDKFVIFIIKEIDNNSCNYSYYINSQKNSDNQVVERNFGFDLMGLGISKLLLSSDYEVEKKNGKELSIKNRNIFANIKRKGT